jgi:glycosyltransferase involved in cell wall biosynthesis
MNTQKLIYLHQYFATPTVSGGTRSWEFSNRLIRDKWHVSMICGNSEIHEISKNDVLNSFDTEIGKFQLNSISLKYSNNMSYGRRILSFFSFAIKSSLQVLREPKADLTFATSTPLTIAIPALLRKWFYGTPYVFEVRDLWPEMPIAVKAIRSPLAIYFARQLELLAYRNASHIVALSPGMKEGIVKLGIASDKVDVIPNGCDNARFNVPESAGLEFLRQHPELLGGSLIVYAGTLGHINGVRYFAHLASQMRNLMPEAKFLVVGSGACENEIKELSKELGILEKNFWIWPAIPKAEMPGLLSACTVATSLFLPIPEMEHNSANKFFDALAAGRPILINYGGWQKEILEQSGAGISIPGNDPQAGAVKLAQFLNSPECLENARNASRKLAYTEFDRDLLYKKLASVFENVLSKTSSISR